jgi:catalase
VADGVDGTLLKALRIALNAEGAQLKIVAPMVGGVEAADGTWIEADEKLYGAPSVVFDAVALLVSEAGTEVLVNESTERDFTADAFAHLKFIAYVDAALPVMERAGIDEEDIEEGCIELSTGKNAETFVEACRKIRFWERSDALASQACGARAPTARNGQTDLAQRCPRRFYGEFNRMKSHGAAAEPRGRVSVTLDR